MPFKIIRNDITKVEADAIVNSANPQPVYGTGTDTAIYRAAGVNQLLAERERIGPIRPGEVAVTNGFALPAQYIIHTVGPVWYGGERGEYETLASCYRKSLLIAEQLGCESIAFPLISTGVYGFPRDKALGIALEVISVFLEQSEMDVTLVVFDRKAYDLSAVLMEGVDQYIDENYVAQRREEEYGGRDLRRGREMDDCSTALLDTSVLFQDSESDRRRPKPSKRRFSPTAPSVQGAMPAPMTANAPHSLEDVMASMGESFQQRLLRLIDAQDLSDASVYKKANLDRKLFSKIRCNPDYTPKKRTAIALAVALRLNLDETKDLIGRAGLALSPSSKFDLIVEYCIRNQIYDVIEINALLFVYDQPLLGS